MTPAAFIMMVVSITSVLGLCSYCLTKVLSLPPLEVMDSLHGQPDIDTGDTENAD